MAVGTRVTAKKAAPTKKAAAKKAAAPPRPKATVALIDPPVALETPATVDAKAVADIYDKAKRDNGWCESGRRPVETALRRLGVPVGPPPGSFVPVYVEIDVAAAGRDGEDYLVSEPFAAAVGAAFNTWLDEVTGGKLLSLQVPRGSQSIAVQITPKIRGIATRLYRTPQGTVIVP